MKKNFYFGLIILVLYLFAQLISPLIIQKYHIELSEPELKTYRSDEVAYLKIFYLVDHGYSYYEASEIARTNFSGGGTITNDVFTWRFPTIFYFWSFLFDSGKQIFTFFIFLSLCLMLASYLIAKKIIGPSFALISPILLFLYIADIVASQSFFLHPGLWASYLFIFGVALLIYEKRLIAMSIFSATIFIRELFLLPVFVLLMVSILKRRWNDVFCFGLPLVLFAAMYLIHQASVNLHLVNMKVENTFGSRFHDYSLSIFQRMISYSMRNFVLFGQKTHYLFFLIGILGLIFASLKDKRVQYILFSALAFILVLPIIGVEDNDYWGVTFMPLVLISTPFWLVYFKKNENSNSK